MQFLLSHQLAVSLNQHDFTFPRITWYDFYFPSKWSCPVAYVLQQSFPSVVTTEILTEVHIINKKYDQGILGFLDEQIWQDSLMVKGIASG